MFRQSKCKRAVCVFDSKHSRDVTGHVSFEVVSSTTTRVECHLHNLPASNIHGFHIHQFGDLRQGCTSAGKHFNPHNKHHGGLRGTNRHLGDLGNITSNIFGDCTATFVAEFPLHDVVGRMLVIHEHVDDLGRSSHPLSKTTGNSGPMIAIGVIGRLD